MRHRFAVRVGPMGFRIGSDWRAPIAALETLYAGYPQPHDDVPDFTVRLFAARPWRRSLRPAVTLGGDFMLPDALPLPLAQGLLAAEMAMNLQVALGCRRYLLLHASAVERDGRALLMTGESGSGKSTLAALLSLRGWRLMGDEFALVDLTDGRVHAFPRLVSLKNESIGVVEAAVAEDVPPQRRGSSLGSRLRGSTMEAGAGVRWGPLLAGTPKGDIRHLVPDAHALTQMDVPATPALLLFPRYGHAAEVRPVGAAEVFVRLTQASTNYVALGEPGFAALTQLVTTLPARAVDYPDTESAVDQVEALWRTL